MRGAGGQAALFDCSHDNFVMLLFRLDEGLKLFRGIADDVRELQRKLQQKQPEKQLKNMALKILRLESKGQGPEENLL